MATQYTYDSLGRLEYESTTEGRTTTAIDYEPSTGRVDYRYTLVDMSPVSIYPSEATDYDLAGTQPWSSFTIHQTYFFYAYVSDTVTVMDDGSTITATVLLETQLAHAGVFPNGHRISVTDAQGHLEQVAESFRRIWPTDGQDMNNPFILRVKDYSTETGQLDYMTTRYGSGITEQLDYDPRTGLVDYAIATYPDGHSVARDFDAAGRLDYVVTGLGGGHFLSEDIDVASGKVDFSIERFANGRSVATDQDLSNAQSWSSQSISRDAADRIDQLTVRNDDGMLLVTQYDAANAVPWASRVSTYDAAGRLDYVTTRNDDGTVMATDYDLADQYAWNSFTISYDAFGNILSTSTT